MPPFPLLALKLGTFIAGNVRAQMSRMASSYPAVIWLVKRSNSLGSTACEAS